MSRELAYASDITGVALKQERRKDARVRAINFPALFSSFRSLRGPQCFRVSREHTVNVIYSLERPLLRRSFSTSDTMRALLQGRVPRRAEA